MQHESLVIDSEAWIVQVGGQGVNLTYLEFRLLRFLAEHPWKVFSRAELIQAAWPAESVVTLHHVDIYIHRLRKKLGHCGQYIKTVNRMGYRFDLSGAIRTVEVRSTPGEGSSAMSGRMGA